MKKQKTSKKSFLEKEVFLGKIPVTQKIFFAKHLSVMLKAGLLLSEAIRILHEQSTGKFKTILSEILSSINSGQSLANSLARHPDVFSNLFISIIHRENRFIDRVIIFFHNEWIK